MLKMQQGWWTPRSSNIKSPTNPATTCLEISIFFQVLCNCYLHRPKPQLLCKAIINQQHDWGHLQAPAQRHLPNVPPQRSPVRQLHTAPLPKFRFQVWPSIRQSWTIAIRQFTSNFKSTLNRLQQRRVVTPNLPPYLFGLVLWLKDHPDYIVVKGDKNFGSCVLERSYYTWKAFQEHLDYKESVRSSSTS